MKTKCHGAPPNTNTNTHVCMNMDFLFHLKPHSAKEIFNFLTPVNMLFYSLSFDLQTDQSCALGDTVQKGDWVVCVFCFIGMLASNGTYLVAILHFIFYFTLLFLTLAGKIYHTVIIIKIASHEAETRPMSCPAQSQVQEQVAKSGLH